MSEKSSEIPSTFKGRGAQINTHNPFLKQQYVQEHIEMIDEPLILEEKTEIILTYPKTLVNKVESPDLNMMYSMNPYQGCEHGCIYCYARNSHQYWGFSAGLDFERKIIVKPDAPEILEKHFRSRNWKPRPIMLSGNTDCYQPVEKKFKLTRRLLEVCLKYKHPVSIITKNALILRDLDILSELAKLRLVHVMVSITGVTDDTRLILEPRTATYKNRFRVLKGLSEAGIPCGVMMAPVIPGLNSHEIASVLETAASNGATEAGYTMVRLNGSIGEIFRNWLEINYPDRYSKVWNMICEVHGGSVNDSNFETRMQGKGKIAESIGQLFSLTYKKYFEGKNKFEFDVGIFNPDAGNPQLSLF